MKPFLLSFAFFVLAGCGVPCKNTTQAEVTSPDGNYVATAFIRNCGATTSFGPQVHLHPVGERAANIGNVFIGDHSDRIQIQWLSATHLVIYSDCAVVQHVTNYHGITVQKMY
jgi:hypothetical protein